MKVNKKYIWPVFFCLFFAGAGYVQRAPAMSQVAAAPAPVSEAPHAGESPIASVARAKQAGAFRAIFQFRNDRLAVAVFALAIAAIALAFLLYPGVRPRRIRRIPGIAAIEEAVGRAAEMGRPVIFLTGLYDVNSIATISGLTVLAHAAGLTASHGTRLIIPCCHPLVYNAARNVTYDSYSAAGKLASFSPEDIRFITEDQWGFAAGVEGIISREKPAACFYFGHFVSESLIYAEAGSFVGAIQIAATNEFTQIPFFVASCDYTLIGEELYAASAYFSKDQRDARTLFAQDTIKIIICALIIAGTLFETAAGIFPENSERLKAFKSFIAATEDERK